MIHAKAHLSLTASFLSISLPDLQLDLNQSVFLCDKYLFTLHTTLNYDSDIINLAWNLTLMIDEYVELMAALYAQKQVSYIPIKNGWSWFFPSFA